MNTPRWTRRQVLLCVLALVLLAIACGGGEGNGDGLEVPAGVQVEGFPYPIGTAEPDSQPAEIATKVSAAADYSNAMAAAGELAGVFTQPNPAEMCGLRQGGATECWGLGGPAYTKTDGDFTMISSSLLHFCGLRFAAVG